VTDTLAVHLAEGTATVARAWRVERKDGVVFGFTEHDRDLTFAGTTFRADSAMSAGMLVQTTGLAVDNAEALGALRDDGVTEDDIRAGRFDGADVTAWIVNWADVGVRRVVFRGTIGAITREGAAFQAELRGLTQSLNAEAGASYRRTCAAAFGDTRCGFDAAAPGFRFTATVQGREADGVYRLGGLSAAAEGWFRNGVAEILDGPGRGQIGRVRDDQGGPGGRRIGMWADFAVPPAVGDTLRVTAGCDKRLATCRDRFGNVANFRGFPHLPGDDWLASYPVSAVDNDGGSLFGGA
jgi:uncharacterized phage protein (TIGR02218 family)